MVAKSWLEIDEEISDEVKIRPRCFMDIVIRGYPHGRIVFELFEDLAPNTLKNFKTFCTEANYRKIKFKLIRRGIVGFEDVLIRHSLYRYGEKTNLKHDQAGLLSTPTDSENMVFGKIVKGLVVLKEIEKAPINMPLMSNYYHPPIEVCLEDKEDDMNNLNQYLHWLFEDIILKGKEDFTLLLAVLGSLQNVALAES
ncbi:hypothetical protein PTKIN_Ptkin03bG0245500 [Pterospermum kingtungense]